MDSIPEQFRSILEAKGVIELLDWLSYNDHALAQCFTLISTQEWLMAHPEACVRLIKALSPEQWQTPEGKKLLALMKKSGVLKASTSEAYKAFMHHCGLGELDEARIWIKAGLDSFKERKSGWTPIHLACATNCVSLVAELLQLGADPRTVDFRGNTPLHYVQDENPAPLIALLVTAGAGLNQINADGETPLHRAVKGGLCGVLTALIAAGANPNYPTGAPRPGMFAFHLLAEASRHLIKERLLKTANALLTAGGRWNVQDSFGHSVIYYACRAGSLDMVMFLLDKGATIGEVDAKTGDTLLHVIAASEAKGELYSVLEAINNRGIPIDVTNRMGTSPLFLACSSGNVAFVKALLKANASVDLKDQRGNTPLHTACMGGFTTISQLLLLEGAKARVENLMGQTPLHMACANGDPALVETLLAQLADPLAQDKEGNLPAHDAGRLGSKEIVELLIKLNLVPSQPNRRGDTPYALALQNPNLRSTQIIAKLDELDCANTYEILFRKALAHLFVEKGYSELESHIFSLEEWMIEDAKIFLELSLKQHYAAVDCWWPQVREHAGGANSPDESLKFALSQAFEAIKSSRDFLLVGSQELAERVRKGHLIAIFNEWEGHAIAAVMSGTRLCRCDCGAMPGGRSGIFYNIIKMPERWHLGIEALSHLKGQETFYRRVNDVLSLGPEAYIPLKTDRPGDFTIANADAMEIGALFLLLEPTLGGKGAVTLAAAIQSLRVQGGREGYLRSYMKYHLQMKKEADYTLLSHIYNIKSAKAPEDQERRKAILNYVDDSGYDRDIFLKMTRR